MVASHTKQGNSINSNLVCRLARNHARHARVHQYNGASFDSSRSRQRPPSLTLVRTNAKLRMTLHSQVWTVSEKTARLARMMLDLMSEGI